MVQQWPVPTRHLKNPEYSAAQLPLTMHLISLVARIAGVNEAILAIDMLETHFAGQWIYSKGSLVQ